MILPEGFSLPALPYLLALLVALGGVAAGFSRRRPTVGETHVVALAPWMVVGAACHVLYVVDALPATLRPLAGTPAVYLTVAAVAGATWLLADAALADAAVPRAVGGVGSAAVVPPVVAALLTGAARGSLAPLPSLASLVVALALAAAVWALLTRIRPGVAVTGWVGALAVFGHVLDGVSTAVGIDVLGFGERTPLSRLIVEFAASLPTAAVVGTGWLFVLVKIAVAAVVVVLMTDYVREDPTEGYLLLGLVTAVGLGPGAHNLLLFAVGVGVS